MEKCSFGIKLPIDIHMLNEIIYREVKHFRNYKIYRPDFGAVPVTGKFYAAHDAATTTSPEEFQKIEYYKEKVAESRVLGPKAKYPEPMIESHCLGWYTKPIVFMDRNDRRFYNPKKESSYTKHEIAIRSNAR